MSVLFRDGIFHIQVSNFTQLKKEIQLDNQRATMQLASRVIIWRKGYDSPMYWSKSLDSLMGITVA